MAYSFIDLAEEVLKGADIPLYPRRIWARAKSAGLIDRLAEKSNEEPAKIFTVFRASLIAEVGENPQSVMMRLDRGGKRNPPYFFLRSRQHEINSDEFSVAISKRKGGHGEEPHYLEKDLHPLLSYFVHHNADFSSERKIYTKTISHSKTRGSAPSEWSHPDMVGVYYPFEYLQENVIKLSGLLNSNSIFQLFSFELKRTLNRNNYRECFFQAVSNSSWAHEGYLVAAEISQDDDLRRELGRLSNSFGIGIIHLNVKNFNAARVLFDAEQRSNLDLDTINKLCKNRDFDSFINRLSSEFGAREVNTSKYDDIINDPIAHIQKKTNVINKTSTQ